MNASIKVNDYVIINPGGYYTVDAGAQELSLGLNAQYDLEDNGDQQVIGGLYYRAGDAVIPMIGFVYHNLRLTFTYDATTSSLKNLTMAMGPLSLLWRARVFTVSITGTGGNRFVHLSNHDNFNIISHFDNEGKFIVLCLCLTMVAGTGFAQDHMPGRVNTYTDEGSGTGFRKENLFIGGSLGLGFASDQFSVGVNPEVGYSLNRWLDAGVVVNFTYNSVRPILRDITILTSVRRSLFTVAGCLRGRMCCHSCF